MKKIIESLRKVHSMAEAKMPFIREKINIIIKFKRRDIKEIENFLGILLDYQFMGIGEKEFDRLNKYYGTFNKEAESDWKRIQEQLLKE